MWRQAGVAVRGAGRAGGARTDSLLHRRKHFTPSFPHIEEKGGARGSNLTLKCYFQPLVLVLKEQEALKHSDFRAVSQGREA